MRKQVKLYDADCTRVAKVATRLCDRRAKGEDYQMTSLTPEMGLGHISAYLYQLEGERFNRFQKRTLYVQLERMTGRIKIYKAR